MGQGPLSSGVPGLGLALSLVLIAGMLSSPDILPLLRRVLMDQAWHHNDFVFSCFHLFLEALIK